MDGHCLLAWVGRRPALSFAAAMRESAMGVVEGAGRGLAGHPRWGSWRSAVVGGRRDGDRGGWRRSGSTERIGRNVRTWGTEAEAGESRRGDGAEPRS
jgi:hypothetical protein